MSEVPSSSIPRKVIVTPVPSTTKPGYKTSEFWLSTAAMILGAITASGALAAVPENSWIHTLVGLIVVGLAALGYTSGRTKVKALEL